MLLHTKPRKFQSGGLTVPSGKIDITWKELSVPKPGAIDLGSPSAGYGGQRTTSGSASSGLPSDVKFLDNQINYWRDKIKNGMAGSSDFVNSADYKEAASQLDKWANARASMLESREVDYKATAKRLANSTSDDLAVFGNKALAKDTTTGKYEIISTDKLLTERVQDSNGAMSIRYSPATVGEALRVRYEDPAFSGFNEDTGATIDAILANVVDTDTVTASMDKLFAKAGVIDDTQTFISSANATKISATDLASLLEDAKSAYTTRTIGTKSNANALKNAVSYFSSIITPEQRQALRGRAMNRFLQQYGNSTINADEAEKYLDDMVNADIADRASIYLRQATSGKISGKSSGSQASAEGISETAKWYANKPAYARASVDPTKKVIIEQKFANTELANNMNLLLSAEANDYNATTELLEGFDKSVKHKTADQNSALRSLVENNLTGNFFLGDRNSTSISSLYDGKGLENVAPDLSTSGRNIKIIKDVPTSKDAQGNFKIEWDYLQKSIEWGIEEGKAEAAIKKATGRGNLSDDEAKNCYKQASDKTGFIPESRPDIQYRDIQMFPILIYDKLSYDDPIGDVFAEADGAQTTYADKNLGWKRDSKIKFTYAFSVMSNDARAFSSDYYGKQFAVADPVLVAQFFRQNTNSARSANTHFDIVGAVISASQEGNKQ